MTKSCPRVLLAFLCGSCIAVTLSGCVQTKFVTAPREDREHREDPEDRADPAPLAVTRALRSQIDTIVVIYAENRAFDNLYGNFPEARNLSEVIDRDGRPLPAYHPQADRDGKVLTVLPPTWGAVTAAADTAGVPAPASRGPP